jgi:hypothetical protein
MTPEEHALGGRDVKRALSASYFARKIMTLPLLLLVASFLIFSAVRLLPGDPARIMAGMQADQSVVNSVRLRLGLDKPFATQYLLFVKHALEGDLGLSIRSHKPVAEEIAERLPFTVALAVSAYLLALLTGLSAGIVAAIWRDSWVDRLVMLAAISGASVPNFWVALMAMNLFAVQLGWLPLLGADHWQNYVLPSITLALFPAGLCANGARERFEQRSSLSQTCIPQCADSDCDHRWNELRGITRRCRNNGDCFWLARSGSADGGCGTVSRLRDYSRHHIADRYGGSNGEFYGGRVHRHHRSAGAN